MNPAPGLFQVPWQEYLPSLADGLLRTLGYTAAGFIGAVTVGLGVALLRVSSKRLLRIPAAIYTELFKNIPLLAIIFITYFGLASIGLRLDAFQAGTLSLVIFYGAYLSEIFRAALLGVHPGQQEAGQALGLSPTVTFAGIIFPQALRLALPGTGTMLVDLLKSTSLLVVISAAELMSQAQLIASETFRALEVYIVISALYFVVCYPLSQLVLRLERRVQAGSPLSLRRHRRLLQARELLAASESKPYSEVKP
ncbi:amino acid ABC transporter permease [Paenarthrobacter nitroguajacolicus]|uniref:amino acid ABC transporter permease n=1 Tax=Paenarthrobacter nitroguajacolicus TaxID=211146 RepID=UPI0015BF713D|nr:amino acid ABC transporter permease [Paenarthrobacter nitroguajacolicus]NWL10056.1 amino acid ABC transporter permease [Paenarthrobacter nitroguajacolicus]